jgi:hypothetical protein
MRRVLLPTIVCLLAAVVALPACSKKDSPKTETTAGKSTTDIGSKSGAGDRVSVIELGTATIGAFSVKASRDQGDIVAGKDAPIDLTVTPTSGTTAKVAAVRFWIGTEDASGSVKAKALIDNPDEPNHWHTHAEIPDPLPAGSRLWVDVEDDSGARNVASFDLQM